MANEQTNKNISFWLDTERITEFPPYQGTLSCDTLVIGGGICGVTAAYLLNQAGQDVILIEAKRIARRTSGYTTAKITSQHQLKYANLKLLFGNDLARQYADANQAAIEKIAQLIDDNNIDCDFSRLPAFVYTMEEKYKDKIENEVKAAQSLGLPASYSEETELPMKVYGAVRFDDQAQFHPVKYINGLVKTLTSSGSRIFEDTRALHIKGGGPYRVVTEHGDIQAEQVVMSTHFPFFDKPGLYFARIYQDRSYLVGLESSSRVNGMYITAEEPVRSVRSHPLNGKHLLMIGGEKHKTGHDKDMAIHYRTLKDFAARYFPEGKPTYQWSAQDCMSLDGVPYIGPLSSDYTGVYTATGFNKWGMTNGTAAAMIISDMIQGKDNPWKDVFNPGRFKPVASAKEMLTQGANIALQYAKTIFSVPFDKVKDVKKGQGRIILIDNHKIAVYRDESGKMHGLSPLCSHMGCEVTWNDAEETWDCPCHGSRYTYTGEIIEGPAVKPLSRIEIHEKMPDEEQV